MKTIYVLKGYVTIDECLFCFQSQTIGLNEKDDKEKSERKTVLSKKALEREHVKFVVDLAKELGITSSEDVISPQDGTCPTSKSSVTTVTSSNIHE